jgi:hypothetical protein
MIKKKKPRLRLKNISRKDAEAQRIVEKNCDFATSSEKNISRKDAEAQRIVEKNCDFATSREKISLAKTQRRKES